MFWHPHEEEIIERAKDVEHTFLSYQREAAMYFLGALAHEWSRQEQIRHQFGLAPWMQFKTPEELAEMGFPIEEREDGVTIIRKHNA